MDRQGYDVFVNGINIHYEIKGQGEALILLHGNGENLTVFDRLVDRLKDKYTVYALDSRGHGKSGEVKRLSYDDMADDVIAFIKEMKIDKPALFGFSDGAIVGLKIAMKEPRLLCALISSGANLTPKGIKKYCIIADKIAYFFTKDEKLRLMRDEPNIPESDLARIEIPVLVTAGSRDLITYGETLRIANGIKGARLTIYPKATHFSYVNDPNVSYPMINDFLTGIRQNKS